MLDIGIKTGKIDWESSDMVEKKKVDGKFEWWRVVIGWEENIGHSFVPKGDKDTTTNLKVDFYPLIEHPLLCMLLKKSSNFFSKKINMKYIIPQIMWIPIQHT